MFDGLHAHVHVYVHINPCVLALQRMHAMIIASLLRFYSDFSHLQKTNIHLTLSCMLSEDVAAIHQLIYL